MNSIQTQQLTGFIAIDSQALWGCGADLASCRADAMHWLSGGHAGATVQFDESMRFYKATAKAVAAVAADGADAERNLIFSVDDTCCYHESEAHLLEAF